MTRGMDYLRNSFTLPNNKKKSRYPPNLSNEVSSKGIPIGSAKMKAHAHKVKTVRHGDSDVLVGDRLDDIYATLPRRQVPDFYGGDCEVEVQQPQPSALPKKSTRMTLDDNFLSVSNSDISVVSDYGSGGSEFDISFRRSGRSTLYATLRRGKKKLYKDEKPAGVSRNATVISDSRRSSTSTVLSSGTGSLPESPPESESGSMTSGSQIYGTIGRCTSKRREILPPWLCDTSTSLPATPSLELAPIFREPPAFVQPPASRVGSLEDLHQTSDDASSLRSFASSTSASTYSNPKEAIYLRPAMLGSAPLQPSPANHHSMPWQNNNSSIVYKSAEELCSTMCSCRDRACSNVAGYRVRACKTMEPLWESEDGQVQLRNNEKHKWYDARKVKHKSCPAFQAHMVAAFEQSLSNMTSRLQHLTATAEQKDSELLELRKTIEALQQQSAEAGLTKAALQSMQAVQRSKTIGCPNKDPNGDSAFKSMPLLPHLTGSGSSRQDDKVVDASCEDSSSSLILGNRDTAQLHQAQSKDKRGLVIRRHTFNNSTTTTTTANNNNHNTINNNNNHGVKENNGGGVGAAVLNALHGTGPMAASANVDKEKKSGMMLPRQLSNDSMSSVNSTNSQGSQQYQQQSHISGSGNSSGSSLRGDKEFHDQAAVDKKVKKKKGSGWLRSSFGKAFSRGSGSGGKGEDGNGSDSSVPNSPQVPRSCPLPPAPIQEMAEGDEADDSTQASMGTTQLATTGQQQQGSQQQTMATQELVDELRKQLRDKDMVLTDIRLEALSSAHQLDQMKEIVTKLKNEIAQLRSENDRLARLVGGNGVCGQNNATNGGQNSENSSACSIPSLLKAHSLESIEKRLSSSDQSGSPTVDIYLNDNIQESRDNKRIPVSVHLTITGDFDKMQQCGSNDEIFIGCVAVSNKTSWSLLDAIVRKAFKEYVLKIDPASNLGLSAESVQCYHIGDMVRTKDTTPELLPCGYLVGNDMQIKLVVKGTAQQSSLDALAFETLIPKAVLARYISLLTEHRRIILCGPSGTGKTFLAHKLAEFLAKKNNNERGEDTIATFSVDRNSQADLKGYLTHMAEQCSNVTADGEISDTPQVLIVDNLHHVASLSDVFNGLLHANSENCPYIIGTMNQARCSTTNLQLSHNFRWVLCANHIEPVKGLLGRCLRRRLVDHEARTGLRSSPELQQVIEWMPQVWTHVNKFLETHNSADATIGPRLFLSCPVDVLSAQVWFTDLWNFTLTPYLIEAAREGLQLYGQRAVGPWEDPVEWLKQSYPFEHTRASQELSAIREDDITSGESTALSNRDSDPLLNMLMRLQEAASYSPQTSISEAAADCS